MMQCPAGTFHRFDENDGFLNLAMEDCEWFFLFHMKTDENVSHYMQH